MPTMTMTTRERPSLRRPSCQLIARKFVAHYSLDDLPEGSFDENAEDEDKRMRMLRRVSQHFIDLDRLMLTRTCLLYSGSRRSYRFWNHRRASYSRWTLKPDGAVLAV